MKSHRYVIMANGKGTRWKNYAGHPKQLLRVGSETLLQRLVRQLHQADRRAEVIISAANPNFDVRGARRHAPARGSHEVDRFPPELLEPGTTFLYGDVRYCDAVIRQIVRAGSGTQFFGDTEALVAVRVSNSQVFLSHLDKVRLLAITGVLPGARGWQLYQSLRGLPMQQQPVPAPHLARDPSFQFPTGSVTNINRPADLNKLPYEPKWDGKNYAQH